jgi:6-phospho-beta-glucosidase
MKMCVIGGGSTYTPELINGLLADAQTLHLRELWLMDISEERLSILGSFARRMVENAGQPFQVYTTTNQREAIAGAQFVVTQIRAGGMEARRNDEYLGMRHHLVGQETTGIGGMAKALRTIPIILRVAQDMAETAPDALLLNFTNPAGLVSEALNRYAPQIRFVGVCNGPYSIQRNLLEIAQRRRGLASEGKQVLMQIAGLNHLSWSYGMTLDGEDVWDIVMDAYLEELKAGTNGHIPFDLHTIESLRLVPSAYLQYFYYTQRKIEQQKSWPPSRAEQVMQIEAGILEQFKDPALTIPPADLMKRGGAYYSTVATQLINAVVNDLNQIHVMNVRHNGAVSGFPDDWVMEIPCRVNATGVTPVADLNLPLVCHGLVTQIKTYELLTVEAAVHGDQQALYQALLAHPLGPAADQITVVLDDLLTTNMPHLPQFARHRMTS